MKNIRREVPGLTDFDNYMERIRHYSLLGITVLSFILVFLLWAVDFFMIPPGKLEKFLLFRAVAAYLLLIQFTFILVSQPSRYSPLHGYFYSMVLGLMVSFMARDLGGFDSGYYAGLYPVLIAAVVLIPWDLNHAVINSVLIVGSYLSVNVIDRQNLQSETNFANLYLLSTGAVVAIILGQVYLSAIRAGYFEKNRRFLPGSRDFTPTPLPNGDLFTIQQRGGEYFLQERQTDSFKMAIGNDDTLTSRLSDVLSPYLSSGKISEITEKLNAISSGLPAQDLMPDAAWREPGHLRFEIMSGNMYFLFTLQGATRTSNGTDFEVSMKDITKEVELANQLRLDLLNAKQEDTIWPAIMNVGPAVLMDFTEAFEMELKTINSVLQEAREQKDFVEAIETICTSVHSLKGNAILLDLPFLAEKAGEFEEKIVKLRDSNHLSWTEFLPVAFELAGIREIGAKMRGLIVRNGKPEQKAANINTVLQSLPRDIGQLALKTATEHGKKVKLVATDVNFKGVASKYAYLFRDILVQLTRNATTHGIETPEQRVKRGKNEFGIINLSLRPFGDNFYMSFRDDGSSFDFPAIRAKAVQMGKASESEILQWSDLELIELTYECHFSTAARATSHCGRGMGMNIIRQRIAMIGGLLKLNYALGQFTEFKFSIPMRMLR